ncbi:hypothetical protein K0M31_016506 [Melipona bicolor]|uniref:Kinetochore protein NDC80 n=1 Tax=Melipona bicolor TaxID=60889 RepID=A0AA40G7J6_9HYME|nr:hypothetical protein K0M31_016506 [Melipona bicolor]
MASNSLERRSSTNPVRICLVDREDKSLLRTESRKTQTLKPKISSNESSHIPRPRMRASSCDRISIKGLVLKSTGKTSICHVPTTPKTPLTNCNRFTAGSSNKIHIGHSKGRRSLSADNAGSIASNIVKGSRKDTRPLTDKAYQTYMLNKIDNFLAINQCSSMLNSNGSLKPVTLKMFVEISAYLVKMLDIKQILTITNYVEELPKVAKKLHYPGIVNKSWLKTANAMHSWPNVLGWLCWLVEICEIRELAFEKYNLNNLLFAGNQIEAKINKNAFFSMLNFYNAWNDEKLDEEALMVEKYLQGIEEQQGVNEENLKIARTELEEKLLKLQAAKEDSSKIDEEIKHLQEVFLSLQNDEEKQLSDINAKEEYIKTINFETDQIKAECNILYEQICLQNTQHDELLSTIKQQPMSKMERDKILEKCTEIQNYMHQFDEHLQEIQKELYTMDIKLASINNNLTKAILTYNTEIFMHLSGDIGVNLEELKMPEKGILQPQIMEVLITKANLMNDLKELLKSQIIKKERLLESNSNELENLQERRKILEYESSDIAYKIKEKKNFMSKIKTDAKHEEAKLKEQIKILQNDIKEIQDLMPNTQQLAAELNEAIDKLNAVQRRKMYIEESAKLFFNKFYEILGEHRNKLHSILIKSNK